MRKRHAEMKALVTKAMIDLKQHDQVRTNKHP